MSAEFSLERPANPIGATAVKSSGLVFYSLAHLFHFPFAFSPAAADADSRIAFSRSLGVDAGA